MSASAIPENRNASRSFAIAALLLVLVLGLASGCGTASVDSTRAKPAQERPSEQSYGTDETGSDTPKAGVQTTAEGTVIATATDSDRGLRFEVQTSSMFGDTGLYVTLLSHAPADTQRLVRESPLVATCDIPDRDIGEFAGYWDKRFDQFGTALVFDPTPQPAARLVKSCQLWIGEEGSAPETARFPDPPYSTVRFG